MSEDRYLDASAYIRTLEEAERVHSLDAEGVLEELEKATAACKKRADYYGSKSTDWLVAKAMYLAEIKERVTLTREECVERGRRRLAGETLEGAGWKNWCHVHKINPSYAAQLVRCAKSADPHAVVMQIRAKSLAINNRSRKKIRTIAKVLGIRQIHRHFPLPRAKAAYLALSPVQRQAFLDWIFESDTQTWQAAA